MENSKPIRKYDLEDRLLEFSLRIISIVQALPEDKISGHLGGQLLRSGTSPAFNYGEAQAAESKKDFLHKIRIVLKELRESSICLRLLDRKALLTDPLVLDECTELVAIFTKSVMTSKSTLHS